MENGVITWSALAERSDDSAFGTWTDDLTSSFTATQSGVALCLPPQSKFVLSVPPSHPVRVSRTFETASTHQIKVN